MLRVEDKYILPAVSMAAAEQKLRSLLPPDSVGGKDGYTVSSLYFDDIRDSMLTDSENGNPFRDKYRIRIYDHSLNVIKLEVKRKSYNRAVKFSSRITEEELRRLMAGETIPNANDLSDARTLFDLAILRRGLRPRVEVCYERNAYVCEQGNVRITFDRNIRASDRWELFGQAGIVYDRVPGEASVLEVKYDACIPRYITQVLECGKMVQTANSKYALCRELYQGKRE